jgi:DNA-binding transcriptional LysR family regulator
MNFHQFKTFYYAAKYESLSAAAEALYITQPAVTKQIQQIQENCGIKLFNRSGKRFILTDAGEALYSIAEKIFHLEDQAEEIIRDFQQHKSGHIRIHASESFGAYYLPSIIIPFSKKHPQIRVSAMILPIPQVVESTVNLDNDLGFISYPVDHKKLTVRQILQDRVVLIASPTHPLVQRESIEPRDLEGEHFVMHEPESATRDIADEFLSRHGLSILLTLELSNNEAIKKAVEQGIGLSLISENVAREDIRRGTLKAISLADPSLSRKFYMIHHKDKYLSQPLKTLIDMIYRWPSTHSKASS